MMDLGMREWKETNKKLALCFRDTNCFGFILATSLLNWLHIFFRISHHHKEQKESLIFLPLNRPLLLGSTAFQRKTNLVDVSIFGEPPLPHKQNVMNSEKWTKTYFEIF